MSTEEGRRLKLGILGLGAASQWYYLPATETWRHRLELKAVCDLDADRARHFGRRYGVDDVYTDYDEMLAGADIDAVAVVTPHSLHAGQCIAALEAGKHVMVEKPLANSLADAQQIVSR